MSILLAALRKSEKDQSLPEAPDIHSDDGSGLHADSIQTGPLAILLVLALFISGWFVWNQYEAPAEIILPSPTQVAGEVRSTDTAVEKQSVTPVQNGQSPQLGTAVSKSVGQPRTPVESYKEPVKSTSVAKPAGTNQPVPVQQKQPVAQTADANQSRPAPAKRADKFHSREPAPISYWELPDSIRADVPEIKFTVLVYAKQPDNRFVLINGQRLGEGDSAQAGLVVKEIRRDGVVFSYRLYQFLVER